MSAAIDTRGVAMAAASDLDAELRDVLALLGTHAGMPTVMLTRVDAESWSPLAVLGGDVCDVVRGERRAATDTYCEEVRRSNQPVTIDDARREEGYLDHPASRAGLIAYIGVPFRGSDGDVVGTLCAIDRRAHVGLGAAVSLFELLSRLVAHEVELDRVIRTSAAARTTEAETAAARERFFAAVAHDLRTPLAAIETSAYLLRRQAHSADRVREGVDRILYSAARMARMVSDLLDFVRGRIGAGIPLARGVISDLRGFFARCVGEVAAAHPRARLVFRAGALPHAFWDSDRVSQCFNNLVTNACVHGAPGRPVSVSVEAHDALVVIEITNDGEIPVASRRDLFNPFSRSGNAAHGLGLGLFIADQVARAHGGRVEVASDAGQTSMRVELPTAMPV